MDYSQLVDKYIKDSGLSLGEIAKRLKEEKGIKIDRSYISKLRNNPKYPASEEINRALAEITGGDPEQLVLAGFYQNAPTEVKSSIDEAMSFREIFIEFIKSNANKELTQEEVEKEIHELVTLPEEEFETKSQELKIRLLDSPPEQLLKSYKLILKGLGQEGKISKLEELKNLRESHSVSIPKMASLLGISQDLYNTVEKIGAIKINREYNNELNNYYAKALDILNDPNIDTILKDSGHDTKETGLSEFEEFINNPEHGIFFKEYLNAPEEKREEMRQIFRILMDKEKGRKPGDRQGE
ncbi:hypothetical protein [Paenibacillus campinasensis]|uniref:Uncharacterized protein n=1 Tax=Paenibacillus campinasensis TaxID=66347 RepID=A0A268EKQ9_9BACL|nr:hypothetical protein [Paenibacillus campinasensis]PAD73701.1 hypothetical protein CHH67_19900 [Paenibacillus campinasensis]